jgi:hypothetical protein
MKIKLINLEKKLISFRFFLSILSHSTLFCFFSAAMEMEKSKSFVMAKSSMGGLRNPLAFEQSL